MAASNLSLKSLLSKERVQHVRWTAISSPTTFFQELQNPVWREHLCKWYIHTLESIERFDGNRGIFPKTVAHVAMKILDMFLSSRSVEFQLMARVDERVYKPIAWACLYNAMRRCSIDATASPHQESPSHPTDGDDTVITVNGEKISTETFLQMCHGTNQATPDQFASLVVSVSSFLDSFACFNHTLPLTSSDVSQAFRHLILQLFPQEYPLFQDVTFLRKLEDCMDKTVSCNRFARNPPSVNSLAAMMVALPETVDRAVLLHLLTQYRMCGGYPLSTLRHAVEELRLEMEEVLPQEREAILHVIPF